VGINAVKQARVVRAHLRGRQLSATATWTRSSSSSRGNGGPAHFECTPPTTHRWRQGTGVGADSTTQSTAAGGELCPAASVPRSTRRGVAPRAYRHTALRLAQTHANETFVLVAGPSGPSLVQARIATEHAIQPAALPFGFASALVHDVIMWLSSSALTGGGFSCSKLSACSYS
jgi:hypothetical protein